LSRSPRGDPLDEVGGDRRAIRCDGVGDHRSASSDPGIEGVPHRDREGLRAQLISCATRGEAPAKARAPMAMAAPYEKAAFLDPEGAGVGISTLARKVLASAAKG
jgi:hypothetical protein